MFAKRTCTLIASLVLALAPLAASAGQVDVSPVRFTFGPGQSIGTLSLANVGVDPLRMQLRVFAWTQAPDGSMKLSPTDDIIVFPTLLTIAPGASRQVRVGYEGPKPQVERTYRIFVEELPSLEGLQRGLSLTMRARVGVPIFVQPPNAKPQGRITGVAVRRNHIEVGLENAGTAFMMASNVAVRALDAGGNPILGLQQTGWYVLAGDRRTYDFTIPSTACSRIHGIALDITTDSGATLRETRPVQSSCS